MQVTTAISVADGVSSSPDDYNKRDLRETKLWRELSQHFQDLMSPAFGKISDASDPELSPDGRRVSFTGTMWTKLEGSPQTRVCIADVANGEFEVVTNGPNNDQQAKWSPDGKSITFLSDRVEKGTFHLYTLDIGQLREAKLVPLPKGKTAEYALWSPAGDCILVGATGQGADKAGGQGSGKLGSGEDGGLPAWMPAVEPDTQKDLWRTLWLHRREKGNLCRISPPGKNFWEAAWCGSDSIVAIASSDASESSWYEPTIELVDVSSGTSTTIYKSGHQMAIPAASPSGSQVAFVEGLFSDRGVIAGTVKLLGAKTGELITLDTCSVDVSQMSWLNDEELFFIGIRGLHAVSGTVNIKTGKATETWTGHDSLGARYPQASAVVGGSFAIVRSSWARYPELALVQHAACKTIASLAHQGGSYLQSVCGPVEEVTWQAPDGLDIEGFLCLPKSSQKPFPLVIHVHGGPVWAFTNAWQLKFQFVPALVAHGYAVLSTNPRGSKGRGEEFSAKVQNDMGGADMGDLLAGIDHLVEKGLVDPKRVGVTGGSYGGFMSTWIITQTNRFAASVALAPSTEWLTQHVTSNIPKFDHLMLGGDPYAAAGQYYDRSPLRFARNVSTPLLQIAGSEDRCTPPSQALQFHNALVERGVESALAIYPGEGHGVRMYPAVIDYCVRMLAWFYKHMPA